MEGRELLSASAWQGGGWAQLGVGLAAGCLLQRCLLAPSPGPTEVTDKSPRPIAQSISDLVGNTPMVRLARLERRHNLVGKCEFMSVYSLKDRPVKQIIAEAEATGKLQPGGTLIETTSGNTGMAVASQAAAKGFKAILCMCEIQSEERRAILRALGADLRLSPRDLVWSCTCHARLPSARLCWGSDNCWYVS
jgi:cysteine synthase